MAEFKVTWGAKEEDFYANTVYPYVKKWGCVHAKEYDSGDYMRFKCTSEQKCNTLGNDCRFLNGVDRKYADPTSKIKEILTDGNEFGRNLEKILHHMRPDIKLAEHKEFITECVEKNADLQKLREYEQNKQWGAARKLSDKISGGQIILEYKNMKKQHPHNKNPTGSFAYITLNVSYCSNFHSRNEDAYTPPKRRQRKPDALPGISSKNRRVCNHPDERNILSKRSARI